MRDWSRIVYDILSPDPHVKSIKVNGKVIWNGSKKEEEMYGMQSKSQSLVRSKRGVVRRLSDYDEGRTTAKASERRDDVSICREDIDEATSLQSISSREGSFSSTWGRGFSRSEDGHKTSI